MIYIPGTSGDFLLSFRLPEIFYCILALLSFDLPASGFQQAAQLKRLAGGMYILNGAGVSDIFRIFERF